MSLDIMVALEWVVLVLVLFAMTSTMFIMYNMHNKCQLKDIHIEL